MRVFEELPIYDIFKIDYPTFMKLPHDWCDKMIKIARTRKEREEKIAASAEASVRAAEHNKVHGQKNPRKGR